MYVSQVILIQYGYSGPVGIRIFPWKHMQLYGFEAGSIRFILFFATNWYKQLIYRAWPNTLSKRRIGASDVEVISQRYMWIPFDHHPPRIGWTAFRQWAGDYSKSDIIGPFM